MRESRSPSLLKSPQETKEGEDKPSKVRGEEKLSPPLFKRKEKELPDLLRERMSLRLSPLMSDEREKELGEGIEIGEGGGERGVLSKVGQR